VQFSRAAGRFCRAELGYKIVLQSARSLRLRQIAVNAGKDDGSVIVEEIKNGKGNIGYDALKDAMIPI